MTEITTDPYTQSLIQQIQISEDQDLSFEMIFVEGGSFEMGNKRYNSEQPIHSVRVPAFYLGRHLVSQELWEAVMGKNPSDFQLPHHPVEMVSWNDCQKFIGSLNELTGQTYRLPSEAEWEYAARGGKNRQNIYAGSGELKEVGWYNDNNTDQTHFPGMKRGNEFGLHDMSGELLEWCEDRWHGNYEGAPSDGSAWTKGGSAFRVLRGGSWGNYSGYCRVSGRYRIDPQYGATDYGLRLALSPWAAG